MHTLTTNKYLDTYANDDICGPEVRHVLTREIRKNRTQPMALIREEFQQASGSIVSMNTIRKEAHLHGFHGGAAAHKP
ncbi:transposable element tcb1 transposase [Caerostris extrusa]|uniref:Transposable element tcb1 transposase n=1 Tax=Caerostris extrusa TaxID=172846 RepID=A0AAV4T5R9_CAEEX|nr:transposable element tcb1 transposase [Caerostris extrusa]